MKNRIIFAGIILIVVFIASYLVWDYMNYLDYLSMVVHDTDRWVVIMDSHGDIIAIETTEDEVWGTLVNLYQNRSEMWIGGIVEEYGNKWGFRFKPETIIVAEQTAEGAQTWIKGLSEDLDYWINTWGTYTYVLGKVVEVHG
jgi:hypothetical protein